MHKRPDIPSYLKHSSGQARVILSGKAFYLGRYGSKASRQRYDALIAEWLAGNRSSTFGLDSDKISMAGLMLDYLKHCKKHYPKSASSEYNATRLVLKVVNRLYSEMPAAMFGPKQFKAIRQKLVDDPKCLRGDKCRKKTAEPLSRNYINCQMKRVGRMFKWGAAEGLVSANIYHTIRLIPSLQRGRTEAPELERVLPVDTKLVDSTLPHCSPVVADMIRFQLLTGCRPAEVCKLTPAMIDRSREVWEANLPEHKTSHHGRDRVIYIGPKAQKVIQPYLDRAPDANLFSPQEANNQRRAALTAQRKTPAVYGNRVGYSKRVREGRTAKRAPRMCYDSRSYYRAITYACDKGGVARWAPNQLRHTAATRIRAEFGLEASQVSLGHSKADTTQIYAEANRQKAIEVACKIG
jgi:integrase